MPEKLPVNDETPVMNTVTPASIPKEQKEEVKSESLPKKEPRSYSKDVAKNDESQEFANIEEKLSMTKLRSDPNPIKSKLKEKAQEDTTEGKKMVKPALKKKRTILKSNIETKKEKSNPRDIQKPENKSRNMLANDSENVTPDNIPIIDAHKVSDENKETLNQPRVLERDPLRLNTISEVKNETVTEEDISKNLDRDNKDQNIARILINDQKDPKTLFSPKRISQNGEKVTIDKNKIKPKTKQQDVIITKNKKTNLTLSLEKKTDKIDDAKISLRKEKKGDESFDIENTEMVVKQSNRNQSQDKTLKKSNINLRITKEIPSVPGVLETPNITGRNIIEQVKNERHMNMLLKDPKPKNLKLDPIKLDLKTNDNSSRSKNSKCLWLNNFTGILSPSKEHTYQDKGDMEINDPSLDTPGLKPSGSQKNKLTHKDIHFGKLKLNKETNNTALVMSEDYSATGKHRKSINNTFKKRKSPLLLFYTAESRSNSRIDYTRTNSQASKRKSSKKFKIKQNTVNSQSKTYFWLCYWSLQHEILLSEFRILFSVYLMLA